MRRSVGPLVQDAFVKITFSSIFEHYCPCPTTREWWPCIWPCSGICEPILKNQMIHKLLLLLYSAKQTRAFHHISFGNCGWSPSPHWQWSPLPLLTLGGLFSGICGPIFKNYTWFVIYILYPIQQNKPEISITFLFWSCEWSYVHPFLTDESHDHHHHFPVWEGFSLVSVDLFLKIIDVSRTTSFALFSKTN